MKFAVLFLMASLGDLKPPLSWKNHVVAAIAHLVALIARVMDNIMCVVVNITHVAAEKAVEEAKSCWPKKFCSLFEIFGGIFNGENTIFFKKH